MAKKRNRGKKSSGTKPSTAAVSENQSQPSSIEDKTNAVKTNLPVEGIGSASSTKSEKNSSDLSVKTDGKDGCGLHASAQKDQGAFLSEFETKALQVATQTAQPAKPEVVEVVKYVEKEVKVEDPALKIEVEKLSKENAELKTQVANLQEDSASAANDSQRVQELQNEISSVNEKVAHYQTVLADTENLLKSLQASVESEEVAWKKRLSDKEKDLHQLVADKANLQLQVKQLEDTIEKVKLAEDMHEKLRSLQQQLQTEEKEKVSLQEKLQQAEEQLARTATQGGGNSEESILELKADNEKLRALVTVGQDASRQQEQLIEQLQKELTAAKTSSTNGPVNEEQCQEGASAAQ